MVWIFATITTVFSAVAFYFTYYIFAPVLLRKGWVKFIILVLLCGAILVALRSSMIYLSFRAMLPDYEKYWGLFRSITASSFHIVYAITFATLTRFVMDRYETRKRMDAITRENLRTELNYLKAQVNPHFLFNIYNTIYFLIEENPSLASSALLKLSGIMQYQLYDCRMETVPLGREIDNIKSYVDLETMRVEETVDVCFNAKLDNPALEISPFILLAFIENAFKHVSREVDRKNAVDIFLSQQENSLEVQIVNTVNNMPVDRANGIGLVNVKRRLELLYPHRYELNINKDAGLYSILLKLTL
jgi:LytS/YehU family sensor histidine kinase